MWCPRKRKCFVDVSLSVGEFSLYAHISHGDKTARESGIEMYCIFNAALSALFICKTWILKLKQTNTEVKL